MDLRMIPSFPNYSVTMDGQVWTRKDRHGKARWLKPGKHPRGHITASLWDGKNNTKKVHRLVLETYVGPCPEGLECRHLDGNPANNHLDNLKWGTRSENQQDSIRHGTHYATGNFGEKHHESKLSNRDRRLIIYQYATGLFSLRELGKLYKVHHRTIGRLVHGKCWPFVKVTRAMA